MRRKKANMLIRASIDGSGLASVFRRRRPVAREAGQAAARCLASN